MTHRDDCPDRWEARREGERAFEHGRGSWDNPYKPDAFGEHGCREAEREWDDSFRSARYDAERREEQLAEERAAHRRAEERDREQMEWEESQERQQHDERDYLVSMCTEGGHAYYGEFHGAPMCVCADGSSTQQEGPLNGCRDCLKTSAECECVPW